MRVRVDAELCTGCGLCVEKCPEVFEMDGSIALTKLEFVPTALEAACREAAESCPVSAIAIEQ